MKQKIYTLTGDNMEGPVNNFISSYYQEAYESRYEGGYLRIYEDYSFFNGNDIMVCIRVDTNAVEKGLMIIEIISGGGSDNIVTGEAFGSENRRIKDFTKSVTEFCKAQGIKLVTG